MIADPNWSNRTLFHGDNLTFLRAMNSESVDLIATDPAAEPERGVHAMTEDEQYHIIGKHTVDLAKARQHLCCLMAKARQYRDAFNHAAKTLDVVLGDDAAPLMPVEPKSIPSNDELIALLAEIKETSERIHELARDMEALTR